MKELFAVATHYSVLLIDAMALLVIVVGTIEAFVNGLRVLLTAPGGHESRDVWLCPTSAHVRQN
jgi:hypothetical protein